MTESTPEEPRLLSPIELLDAIEADRAHRAANPTLRLKKRQILCKLHLEPFQRTYPEGMATFSSAAPRTLLEDPAYADFRKGDLDRLLPLLDEKPICCRLRKTALERLYLANPIATELPFCKYCHDTKVMGAAFRLRIRPDVAHKRVLVPVCFHCVVHRMTEF